MAVENSEKDLHVAVFGLSVLAPCACVRQMLLVGCTHDAGRALSKLAQGSAGAVDGAVAPVATAAVSE